MRASRRWCLLSSFAALAAGQSIDKADQDFWNQKFRDPKTGFRREPSPLLVDAIQGRRPGQAIDLGMGEGRNTIFLAQQGWDVTGVDISDAGVAQARARAGQLGVKITGIVDSLDHYPLGIDRWDLIVLFYVHAWYQSARPASANRMLAALKPGGLLVMEGFAGEEKFLFKPNELLRDFATLHVLRYQDGQGEAEWAPGKRSRIVRFVAEKPK